MRLGFLFLIGFCAACSLNPQPFPPDTNDAGNGSDATMMGSPDGGEDSGSFGDDTGTGPDAGHVDAGDGGLDASDASEDAAEDATEDAPEDAPLDTRDDG